MKTIPVPRTFFALFYAIFLLNALAVLTVGCANNPIATAQTLEQKGDAVYGTYSATAKQANELMADPAVSDEVKRRVATAVVAAKEPSDQLYNALVVYRQVAGDLAGGASSTEKLGIAAADLQKWLNTAQPLVNALVKAVGGTKS